MNFAEVLAHIETLLLDCSANIDLLIMPRGGMYLEFVRIAYVTVCTKQDIPMDRIAERLERHRTTILRLRQRHDDYILTSNLYRRIYEKLSKPGAELNKREQIVTTTASPQYATTTGHRACPGAFNKEEAPCNHTPSVKTPDMSFPSERTRTILYPPEGIL